MKKQEVDKTVNNDKKSIKFDINTSLDLFGVGQAAESAEGVIGKVIESKNFQKLSTGNLMYLIMVIIGFIAIIVTSSLDIKAFANFRFDILLYVWFGFTLISLILFLILGNFSKNK